MKFKGMDFIVLTIFPEMFKPFGEHGIIGRAVNQDKISVSEILHKESTVLPMTGHTAVAAG